MFLESTKKLNSFFVAVLLLLFGSVFILFSIANAQSFNQQINYQGKLLDSSGSTVSDGTYSIQFRLYDTASGGTNLWSETQSVSVTGGLFSVMLGTSTSLASVDFNQTLYLGINVDSDGEMSPRKILGTVPSAFEAVNAQTVGGIATSSFLRGDIANTATALLSFSGGLTATDITSTGTTTVTTLDIGGEKFTSLTDGGSGLTNNGGTLTTSISEANLNIDAAPVNGYVLQASSTATGGFVWSATSTLGFGTSDVDALPDLSDVALGSLTSGDLFSYNGTSWQNVATSSLKIALTDTTGTLDISDRSNLAVSATGLTLNNDTIELTSGYNIPLVASSTAWTTFYDVPSTRITAGTDLSWSGNTLNYTGSTGATTFLGLTDTPSSFTANRIPFTNGAGDALTDSTNLTFASNLLSVNGTISVNDGTAGNELFGQGASSAGAASSTIIGRNANVTAGSSFNKFVVIGTGATAGGFGSNVVIGADAIVGGAGSTVIGSDADGGSHNQVMVLGEQASVGGARAVAIGQQTHSQADGIAIGHNITAFTGEIALGGNLNANFAPNIVVKGATTAFTSRNLFSMDSDWLDSTDATRRSQIALNVYNSGGSETFMRADATSGGVTTSFNGGNVGIGTTTPSSKLTLENLTLDGDGVAGIDQWLVTTNSVDAAVQFGNYSYLTASNTATTTVVGNMLRIKDGTSFGNTVRGLEVQTNRGGNTKGENTALSGFARTFGVRGVTSADAGESFEPAGGYFETQGTTQGNAIRGYSSTITTGTLLSLFHDSSSFVGTGLEMNFGNSTGGSFSSTSSRYLDFQNAGTSVFSVSAFGTTTIGDGSTMASLLIPYGGICVDNDGSCAVSASGTISAVDYLTGNSDLAEIYFSSTPLETGEVVQLMSGLSVDRAAANSNRAVIGVVSTKPGLTLGADDSSLQAGEKPYPIALTGRVPVKLSTENGPIKAGDPLMLSSLAGVAMKADGTGAVVGIALEDFDDTRMYSETYINQFGDDIVDVIYEPIRDNTDSRIDDGCYYGGGSSVGEEVCTPLKATSSSAQIDEANQYIENEAKAKLLAELAATPSTRTTLPDGTRVRVGQLVMFVDLNQSVLSESQLSVLQDLVSTSSINQIEGQKETLFDRIKALASNFVNGVLTLTGLKADRVETKELCVDGVCIDANDLRSLLDAVNESDSGGEVTPAGNTSNTNANEDDVNVSEDDATNTTTTDETADNTQDIDNAAADTDSTNDIPSTDDATDVEEPIVDNSGSNASDGEEDMSDTSADDVNEDINEVTTSDSEDQNTAESGDTSQSETNTADTEEADTTDTATDDSPNADTTNTNQTQNTNTDNSETTTSDTNESPDTTTNQ